MDVFIAGACRTAIGKFLGSLRDLPAPNLGAHCLRESLRRAGVDPREVEEVLLGCVLTAGMGQNPARQAAIRAGIPESASAITLNKVCGSGLQAIMTAASMVRAGDGTLFVAGGMENMSLSPHLLRGLRQGYRLGHGEAVDSMVNDGLWDAFDNVHMGDCAERVAEKHGIGREEQDRFSLESHQKAVKAQYEGGFTAEIAPLPIPSKKDPSALFQIDESPRADSSIEKLAKLAPIFRAGGTVTAGNAPGCNDGAATVVVFHESRAKSIIPEARIMGTATAGVEPQWVMIAPVVAVRKLLDKLKVDIHHFDLIEANEAFAVQALGVGRELGWDPARVNVHGGAVALGHPIGASGARILVTLIHALKRRKLKRGIATLCLGGGNAVAMAIEVP